MTGLTVPAAAVAPQRPAPSPVLIPRAEAVVEYVLGHEMHVMAFELKAHPARPHGALPRLVTINELAQQIGMSVRNIRRLVSERSIPHYKLGRLVRFDVDEVVEWLAASHVTGEDLR